MSVEIVLVKCGNKQMNQLKNEKLTCLIAKKFFGSERKEINIC